MIPASSLFVVIPAVLISFALIGVVIFYIRQFGHVSTPDHYSYLKEKPVPYQIEIQLQEFNLPKKHLNVVTQRLTNVVKSEVDKVRTEMEKEVLAKEEEVKQIEKRCSEIEGNYQKLEKHKQQTESVVHSIAKGLIILNDEGKVVFVNPDAEKIFGHKAQDLLGKQITSVQGEHFFSMVNEEGIEEASNPLTTEAREDMKASTAVIETVSGQTKGIVSVPVSKTQKIKVEDYKNEFLANVTHELRSPLICIQKSIQAIEKDCSEDHKVYLGIALRNASRLEKLVNDILDLSKMEAGKLKLHYQLIGLQPFIHQITHSFTAWSDQKEIEIIEESPADIIFNADETRLEQVMANLISNAIKFTPRRGKIRIKGSEVQKNTGTGDRDWITISVTDSGPGISEADAAHIFQKFVISGAKPTDGEKSSGLGLSLAKQIVELHHGTIAFENDPQGGARFTVALPKSLIKN